MLEKIIAFAKIICCQTSALLPLLFITNNLLLSGFTFYGTLGEKVFCLTCIIHYL